jgi:hypothetical protein
VPNANQSYPLSAIYNFTGPPGVISCIYFCSLLVMCTLSVMTIPLPGYMIPFEKPPYFNFIYYKNGLMLGLIIQALDDYFYSLVSNTVGNTIAIKLVGYGVVLGGLAGGFAAGTWWWCKTKRKDD